ncbi:MAG: hypothetical protein KDA24_09305 [Deltaproteobacteria bacterium]|nr:hypothetical protein [Deltaproteobacteria bacterium]
MLRTVLLLSCLGLLVGCPSGNDDDSASNDDDSVADITPEEGSWELTLTTLITDSCNLVPNAGPGDSLGTTDLALGGDADFVMTDSDDQTFDCTNGAGNTFSCIGRPFDVPVPAIFANATVTRAGSRTGVFTSATEATLGSNVNTDTCEGSDCTVIEQAEGFTYPCVFEFEADADK